MNIDVYLRNEDEGVGRRIGAASTDDDLGMLLHRFKEWGIYVTDDNWDDAVSGLVGQFRCDGQDKFYFEIIAVDE